MGLSCLELQPQVAGEVEQVSLAASGREVLGGGGGGMRGLGILGPQALQYEALGSGFFARETLGVLI